MWLFIKRFLKDIKTDLYHSSLLASGNLVSQIVVFFAYPVITRLFSASQFGEFSLFLSITSILAIISTGRLEYAMILPDNDSEARNIKKIAVWWCVLFSLACFIVSLILGLFGQSNRTIPGLHWIGFFVFLYGITQIFIFYRNREKQYKTLATISILQNTVSSGAKILFGLIHVFRYGLIWGNILGQLVAAVLSAKGYVKQTFSGKPKDIKATLHKYKAFPKYRMIQAVINTLSSSMPIFFVTYYFSKKEAGYFALVMGIAYKIIGLISQALYQVLFKKFTELHHRQEPILHIFLKVIMLLFITGFFPCLLIFIFAKPLVMTFFGIDWLEVNMYIKIMLPWLLFVFMAQPFAFMADIFSLQKQILLIDIAHLLIRTLALYVGFWLSNVYLSITLFSLVSIFVLFFILIWYYFILKKMSPPPS